MAATPDIRIASSTQEWGPAAASLILSVSQQAIQAYGRCLIALSGGSTPKTLYQVLATPEWSARFDWSRMVFLFGDERCTAPDHPESNFRMAQTELFQPLNIRSEQVYRMNGESDDTTAAAQEYEATLRRLTNSPAPRIPVLDLVLLGIGEDGHTASLFPGTPALQEDKRIVIVGHAPTGIRSRLTLTLGVLNHAAVVLFLVTGAGKADIVRRILEPKSDEDRSLPAARISPASGRLVWMLDHSAAQQLQKTPSHRGET
ncbi:MAG: 6-phosphogluconolactonase [Nitrospira sp.]|nr:MAG: 6-phosphogluconolactonase [Nitrospira sp.]